MPNLVGAGVVVGVVDSCLSAAENRDAGVACGACSTVASPVSICSSLAGGVDARGACSAPLRADSKPLPNIDGPLAAAGCLMPPPCDWSGLKEDSSLKGVEPKRPPDGLVSLEAKAELVGAFELSAPPNEPPGSLLPLPNTPGPEAFSAETALKPPCLANAEKPPDDGDADAAPSGLWLLFPLPLLFAKLENPAWPKAGAGTPPAAQDEEVLIPNCED